MTVQASLFASVGSCVARGHNPLRHFVPFYDPLVCFQFDVNSPVGAWGRLSK